MILMTIRFVEENSSLSKTRSPAYGCAPDALEPRRHPCPIGVASARLSRPFLGQFERRTFLGTHLLVGDESRHRLRVRPHLFARVDARHDKTVSVAVHDRERVRKLRTD